MSYASLHTHSDNSLLDGLSTVDDIAQFAADNGQSAVALTDHGNLMGALKFSRACWSRGVKPILGCEVYVAEGGLDVRDQKKTRHLILLAQNDEGWKNLVTLVTRASAEGQYYKPRVDRAMLGQHNAGLIALSGCLGSELSQAILRADHTAVEVVNTYAEMFDDRYFLEIQDHGIHSEDVVRDGIVMLAELSNIPIVATQDSHYTTPDQHDLHDTMLCIQTMARKSEPPKDYDDPESKGRFAFSGGPYSLHTERDMLARFEQYPDAVSNSQHIADMCDVHIATGHAILPKFDVPNSLSDMEYLTTLCKLAVPTFYQPRQRDAVMNRLYYELEVIGTQNLASYFLIVHDIVRAANERGAHIGPGRGSAAGSVVAYLLGITTIEPLRYDLVFERFLNMARYKLPDIDLDIDPVHRRAAIQYITEKYGADKVAQIVTIGTFQEKNAVQSVARARMIPAEDNRVINEARKLEGRAKNLGRHAAGIVISPQPLLGWVPLTKAKDDTGTEMITQWEMHDLENVGLLKIDLLGLSNLSTIHDTVALINDYQIDGTTRPSAPNGVYQDFEIEDIPLDDVETFKLISRGDVVGVFQLDSYGGRKIARQVRPQSIEELGVAISLNRPGPLDGGVVDLYIDRRDGRAPVEYLHTLLEPALRPTFGVIIYQEQIMQIASEVAGYSMGEADVFRAAVGKKNEDELKREHDRFVAGSVQNGLSQKQAEELFRQIEFFANYGFNKSHAIAYATVGYQTAYLKSHYPMQFFTALLNVRMDRPDKFAETLKDARAHNITILRPDINKSSDCFTVEGTAIRRGLVSVPDFGKSAWSSLARAREKLGKFSSLDDVLGNCNLTKLNEGALKALIKVNGLDDIGAMPDLLEALVPTTIAWKEHKENVARIRRGEKPIVHRKKAN